MFLKIKRYIHNFRYPIIGHIVMLHRVTFDRSVLQNNKQYEITPDFLEKIILGYKAKGYMFISLDELYQMYYTQNFPHLPFVCFTLDDGYLDNYTEAYPIFQKYQCPFAIYITTDNVSKKAFLWRYILEDLILKNETILLTNGVEFNCITIENKNNSFNELAVLFDKLSDIEIYNLISTYNFDTQSKCESLMMSEAILKELSNEKLCTIGSHTVSHPHLNWLSLEIQKQEMVQSKVFLESLIGKSVNHFAYPYGAFNSDTQSLVHDCGYLSAVTAWGGGVRRCDKLKALTRCVITE